MCEHDAMATTKRLLLLVALLVAAGACGSDSDSSDGGSNDSTDVETASSVAPEGADDSEAEQEDAAQCHPVPVGQR
jgi:ABC-type glycerol-3-phosphate transport system substrate-binding protein